MTHRRAFLLIAGIGLLTAGAGAAGWVLLFPSRSLTQRLNLCRSEPWRDMSGDRNLYRPISIAEAEEAEHYMDPLARCPTQPFGHLNAAWQRFLLGKPMGAQLWSFEDPRTRSICGYAWVRLGKIHSEIVVRG
jgi:hypothetical protein